MNTSKKNSLNVRAYNRRAWDEHVSRGDSPWTKPVTAEVIAAARKGAFSVLLTETKPVPRHWFPDQFNGFNILALASGGGQQGPVFAAMGANVTVFDNSPKQLEQDLLVAERENLTNLRTVEGDARDLSMFADESFDLVFNPVSTVFIPEVIPIWKEAHRVLRSGGRNRAGGILLAGLQNPAFYLFDFEKSEQGILEVTHRIPYADVEDADEREYVMQMGWPLEFSHTLTDLIGGQCAAGFVITDLYEDRHADNLIGDTMPTYIATRAVRVK